MRILLCDDATFMKRVLKNILVNAGHEIVGEASNGLEAVEKYKELSPDLVTLDITMPKLDGLQGLKQIIEYDNKANVIMCSAMGQDTMILEAIKLGAKDFIVKPFQVDIVLNAINQINKK